jgi:hypothetical protein
VGALLHTESAARPIKRPVPEVRAYQSFVSGLDDYVHARYAQAARHFAFARDRDTSFLAPRIWLVETLLRARQFSRADSASRVVRGARSTHAEAARAMRGFTTLRADLLNNYAWSYTLAQQNAADDLASFELALAALALGRTREARRIFSEMKPAHGAMHGRPEYYQHHAAAYHLMGNHRAELKVVRAGLMARGQSLDVRLASCRARAALHEAADASAALNAIAAADTDTTGATITIRAALDDCAAELDAHGLPHLAIRARERARGLPAPPALVRDSTYEPGHLRLAEARTLAELGQLAAALTVLGNAVGRDLPFYEPRRMMLHAEPAFRRLRNTRGFLRINHPRG